MRACPSPAPGLLVALSFAGCSEDPDFLDPDVVHDLARASGTAEGFDLSGQYITMADPLDCGCQGMLGPGLSLCSTIPPGQTTPVTVIQSDGFIVFRVATDTFTGPVEDDGTFSVGAIVDVTSGTMGLELVARMDGAFGSPDVVPVELEGELWWRAKGESIDATGEPTRVDCTEHLEVTGLRY